MLPFAANYLSDVEYKMSTIDDLQSYPSEGSLILVFCIYSGI